MFGPGSTPVEIPEPTPEPVQDEPPAAPIQRCAEATGSGDDPLIDDFEDRNLDSLERDGRAGSWFSYNSAADGAFAMTGMLTVAMISRIFEIGAIRATPPSLRMSEGTRSSAITAEAPAFSAIAACSAFVTSIMTPPFSISASPTFTRNVSSRYIKVHPQFFAMALNHRRRSFEAVRRLDAP
jgi:hypothetical protein